MPPLNPLDTWSVRTEWECEKPRSKCFLVGEGTNTEYWYFEALSCRLAKEGKPALIEIKPVERTDSEKNQSSPRKLMEHALAIMDGQSGDGEFEHGIDNVVVCFDTDIYKNKQDEYMRLLGELDERDIGYAVTYPSFELYLLLHKENSVEGVILPNEAEIVANRHAKGSRRRFIEKLASDELGMNLKSNRHVGDLAANFEIALQAESRLNQDPSLAIGRLTSNVAKTIQDVIDEGAV